MGNTNKETLASKIDQLSRKIDQDEVQEKDSEDRLAESMDVSKDINELLESNDFNETLDKVCRSVFTKFGASPRYCEWEDLRQDVEVRFGVWLRGYKGDAHPKLVLRRIASNLCVDEARHKIAQDRAHIEADFNQTILESLPTAPAASADAKILLEECRSHLTGRELDVFDKYFIEGMSLREIAVAYNVSRQATTKKLYEIIKKLRLLIIGEQALQAGRPEDKLEQMLLKEGLISEIPAPITDFTGYRKRKPVKVKGKPISETIIEERR